MSPAPFNFSLSSQCSTIQYLPYRDGPISTGWNVSYSATNDSTWALQSFGSGTSAHRTTHAGATLQIDWLGTAIYLYGTSPSDNYYYTLDGTASQITPNSAEGLLAYSTGLDYGDHTAVLTVGSTNEEVTFRGMVLTVGVGNGGATIINTTETSVTSASDGNLHQNPFFTYGNNNDWGIDTNFGNNTMATFKDGAKVFFTLQNTSAFFLIGTMNYDHNAFNATLNPPVAKQTTELFNDSSRWLVQSEVLYWQSGMDRDKAYDFQVENIGLGALLPPAFSFYSVVMMDAVDPPSQTITPSKNETVASHHSLSAGAIAGIAIGPIVLAVVSILALYFLWFKRRRVITYPSASEHDLDCSPYTYRGITDMTQSATVPSIASAQTNSYVTLPMTRGFVSSPSTVVEELGGTGGGKEVPPPAYDNLDTGV